MTTTISKPKLETMRKKFTAEIGLSMVEADRLAIK